MIKVLQLLCPRRHAIVATAFDDQSENAQTFKAQFEECVRGGKLGKHCGICGSIHLVWEEKDSKFPSVDVALRVMKVLQVANLATRALLDSRGETFDAQAKLRRN